MSDNKPKKPFDKYAAKDYILEDTPEQREEANDDEEIEFNFEGGGEDDIEFVFEGEDGEEDEEHLIPQEALFSLAAKAFPDAIEVQKVLENASNLDYICVLTAIAAQEELGEKMPAAELDRLTAAALLMSVDNLEDIRDVFSDETLALVDEFHGMLAHDAREDRLREIAALSTGAKHLLFCSIIADLQMTSSGIDSGEALLPPGKALENLGYVISRVSRGDLSRVSRGNLVDRDLIERAALLFNDVCAKAGIDLMLETDEKGEVSFSKNEPPPSPSHKPRRPGR